ncbi:peptidase S8/S53 domain-containing protein [Thelephora terrestris]|uniref:Peptidase S8/S53 domain-containing protein n=1 Tax=Thelephora terrestris TaxID=56493 RepID=A0A9P6HDZ6_9AGAM|nr:peptidase S8/S53 domain-containing protein [Thelephora terrestris]
MLPSLCLSLLITSVIATPLSTPHDIPRERSPLALAPFHTLQAEQPDKVLNHSYIVMLKDDLHSSTVDNHFNFLQAAHEEDPLLIDGPVGISQVYNGHLKGYAGRFTDAVVQRIREMPEVAYVEQDSIVHALETQRFAPWGLARISHRKRLGLGTFTLYEHDPAGGEGVDVYIIDTGININHLEFEGRASWGKTIPQNDVDEDGNGHGTHCAGTVGSRKYGVAKAVNLIAVKVLSSNGSGTMADVVGGVLWAAEQAASRLAAAKAEYAATGRTRHKGSVANMSLGGGKSMALDDAVNKAVDSGMHFAVAAGNDNRDACTYSPAAAEKAITVGASTLGDERAYFSNFGECVDVFAPGLNILSTWTGTETATNTISGTSMASPHTAGLLAYLLSLYPSKSFDPDVSAFISPPVVQSVPQRALGTMFTFARAALPSWMSSMLPPPILDAAPVPFPTLTPIQLKRALLSLATPGVFGVLPPKTPNLLIFNNATGS